MTLHRPIARQHQLNGSRHCRSFSLSFVCVDDFWNFPDGNLLRLGAGAATIGLEATAAEAFLMMLLELLVAVDLLINLGCLGVVQSPTRAVAKDAALPEFQTA